MDVAREQLKEDLDIRIESVMSKWSTFVGVSETHNARMIVASELNKIRKKFIGGEYWPSGEDYYDKGIGSLNLYDRD